MPSSNLDHSRLQPGQTRPRVVIIGGGFGGLTAAKTLAHTEVDVTLVDRINHHLFQPLLYQVATGILSDGQIAPPLRGIFREQRNLDVHLAEVTALDLDRRQVTAITPDGRVLSLPYEYLIVAAGSTHTYFGHDEWEQFAPGLKSLADAHRLRSRILGAFEMAAEATSEREREEWLTFVTVGAGPTGVELSGQIAELSRRLVRGEYKTIEGAKTRIVLLDAVSTVLGSFPEKLQQVARHDLDQMGIEIRTDTKVTGVDAEGVDAEDKNGQKLRIRARTVVWAAGVAASPLARMLAESAGAQVDRAGRIEVNPDCSVPRHPDVFAIGDMVALDHLPGVAQPAIQEGRYVARTIRRRVRGRGVRRRRFHYFDKGTMAAISHDRAVADAFRLKVWGRPGVILWGVVHVAYLVGWGNRLGIVGRWFWSIASRERRELCIVRNEEILPDKARPTLAEQDSPPAAVEMPSAR